MNTVPIILTRWVLLITISYAVIFSAPAPAPLWPHQVFIALILASNLVLTWVLSRGRSRQLVTAWATGLDIATVSMAISVAGNISVEFYLIFFSVLILAAVITGRGLLITLTTVACAAYAALMWADGGTDVWRSPALLVRLPVLLGVALYFGTAVQTARREQQRQADQLNLERQKALAALTEMGNVAFSGGYPGPVLYELAGWVQELVEFDRCSLLVFGEGGQRGYLAASGDDPSVEVLALETANYPELGPVLERGEYTEIHPGTPADLWEEVQAKLPQGSRFNTFIVVPIKRGNDVVGALYLRDSNPERTLSEAQTAFCFQAAQMAAAFIYENDLLAMLKQRSHQDPLTGLMSYREFIEQAEKSAAAARPDSAVSMAVINPPTGGQPRRGESVPLRRRRVRRAPAHRRRHRPGATADGVSRPPGRIRRRSRGRPARIHRRRRRAAARRQRRIALRGGPGGAAHFEARRWASRQRRRSRLTALRSSSLSPQPARISQRLPAAG